MFGRISLVMAMTGYVFADDANCQLSGQSLYGYQVRIWDKVSMKTVAHGSIIAYLAVVSGCSTFEANTYPYTEPQRYEVIGQNLTDMRKFDTIFEWCTQTRTVKQIIPHPKCIEANNPKYAHERLKQAFDFSIFLLNAPFETKGSYTYPTFTLPHSARMLLLDIVSLNVEINAECEIPTYREQGEKLPRSRTECLVKSIPFHSECLEPLCNFQDENDQYVCFEFYSVRANATQLCQRPMWSSRLEIEASQLNWYVGTPYACNGTSYGQAGAIKHGQTIKVDGEIKVQDFWYVPTYLRVWPWLLGAISRFGASSFITPFYVEAQSLNTESIAAPSKAPINDQILPHRVPHQRNLRGPPQELQKEWYRSAGPSSRLSGFVFSFILIAQV